MLHPLLLLPLLLLLLLLMVVVVVAAAAEFNDPQLPGQELEREEAMAPLEELFKDRRARRHAKSRIRSCFPPRPTRSLSPAAGVVCQPQPQARGASQGKHEVNPRASADRLCWLLR